MTEYNRARLGGNPIRAFAIDRAEGARPLRPPSPTVIAAQAEGRRLDEARRLRMQAVRENRLSYRNDIEYFAALRRAQAGEEIEEGGGQ